VFQSIVAIASDRSHLESFRLF